MISEKSGSAEIRIIVFPEKSIFDETESSPQSLQVSEAIFVTTHIPKHLNRISNFSFSIPETEISFLIKSKISVKYEIPSKIIRFPEERAAAKANSGLYCF